MSKNLIESAIGRVIYATLSEGEDLLEAISLRAKERNITTGFFFLIGVLGEAKLGFYRRSERRHETIEISGLLEIASCMGSVSIRDGKPFVHAHISVANERGEAFGGHVLPGCIIAVRGELVLVETISTEKARTETRV